MLDQRFFPSEDEATCSKLLNTCSGEVGADKEKNNPVKKFNYNQITSTFLPFHYYFALDFNKFFEKYDRKSSKILYCNFSDLKLDDEQKFSGFCDIVMTACYTLLKNVFQCATDDSSARELYLTMTYNYKNCDKSNTVDNIIRNDCALDTVSNTLSLPKSNSVNLELTKHIDKMESSENTQNILNFAISNVDDIEVVREKLYHYKCEQKDSLYVSCKFDTTYISNIQERKYEESSSHIMNTAEQEKHNVSCDNENDEVRKNRVTFVELILPLSRKYEVICEQWYDIKGNINHSIPLHETSKEHLYKFTGYNCCELSHTQFYSLLLVDDIQESYDKEFSCENCELYKREEEKQKVLEYQNYCARRRENVSTNDVQCSEENDAIEINNNNTKKRNITATNSFINAVISNVTTDTNNPCCHSCNEVCTEMTGEVHCKSIIDSNMKEIDLTKAKTFYELKVKEYIPLSCCENKREFAEATSEKFHVRSTQSSESSSSSSPPQQLYFPLETQRLSSTNETEMEAENMYWSIINVMKNFELFYAIVVKSTELDVSYDEHRKQLYTLKKEILASLSDLKEVADSCGGKKFTLCKSDNIEDTCERKECKERDVIVKRLTFEELRRKMREWQVYEKKTVRRKLLTRVVQEESTWNIISETYLKEIQHQEKLLSTLAGEAVNENIIINELHLTDNHENWINHHCVHPAQYLLNVYNKQYDINDNSNSPTDKNIINNKNYNRCKVNTEYTEETEVELSNHVNELQLKFSTLQQELDKALNRAVVLQSELERRTESFDHVWNVLTPTQREKFNSYLGSTENEEDEETDLMLEESYPSKISPGNLKNDSIINKYHNGPKTVITNHEPTRSIVSDIKYKEDNSYENQNNRSSEIFLANDLNNISSLEKTKNVKWNADKDDTDNDNNNNKKKSGKEEENCSDLESDTKYNKQQIVLQKCQLKKLPEELLSSISHQYTSDNDCYHEHNEKTINIEENENQECIKELLTLPQNKYRSKLQYKMKPSKSSILPVVTCCLPTHEMTSSVQQIINENVQLKMELSNREKECCNLKKNEAVLRRHITLLNKERRLAHIYFAHNHC